MNCPLCKSHSSIVETVSVKNIIQLWAKQGVLVEKYFSTEILSKYICPNCGLGFFNPFLPGDDMFYRALGEWDWYYNHPGKTEYPFSGQMAKSGMSIIDVGSGIGEFTKYIPNGVQFIGAELSSKAVEIAQSLNRNVKQMDIIESAFSLANSFDMVTCFQVLEHITDIHDFFGSLTKLCRPGGKIIIAVPNNDGFLMQASNNIMNMPPHHSLLWNKTSLFYIANLYNLVIEDYFVEQVTNVHLKWFYATKISSFILWPIQKKPKLVDRSIIYRCVNKLSTLLASALIHIAPKSNQPGHTSILVLRKSDSNSYNL